MGLISKNENRSGDQKESTGGSAFSIPVQINYEDTDAGGVVYYANYLAYMERARNAWLRYHGFPLSVLAQQQKVIFVVTDARLRYIAPALLDDELQVTLVIGKPGAARVEFVHEVRRDDQCLVRGWVSLATIDAETFKPRRIPGNLRNCFMQPHLNC